MDEEQLRREQAELQEETDRIQAELQQMAEDPSAFAGIEDIGMLQDVYYLWTLWADFHIYITRPYIKPINPAKIIEPQVDPETGQLEEVYPIFDFGDVLSTSRGKDLARGLRTTGKLNNTAEKMARIAIKRCNDILNAEGGGAGETEREPPRVAFRGHEIPQRKAFETIITLDDAMLVVNFDPGEWGEKHLITVEEMNRRGYGPPKFSPVI